MFLVEILAFCVLVGFVLLFCSMEQILREMIERMVGRKMVVPRDFAWLSEKVEERTQQRVSASTLLFVMFRVGIRDDLYIKIIYK